MIAFMMYMMYFSRMAGDEVTAFWRGDLNVTYRYGPGFAGPDVNRYRDHTNYSMMWKSSSDIYFIYVVKFRLSYGRMQI